VKIRVFKSSVQIASWSVIVGGTIHEDDCDHSLERVASSSFLNCASFLNL